VETRIVLLLALAVAISGCADTTGDTNTNSNIEEKELGTSSGKGLEIKSLGVADETLTPGQQTQLSLTLKNYHTKEIEMEELSVFNDGQLVVGEDATKNNEDKTPECDPEEIQRAEQDVAPEMICTWTLTAPSKEDLGAFNSKPLPVNVRIAYDSNIINSEPLKLQFRPLSDIDSAETVTKTFSNGEVKASMEVEKPAPVSGKTMYLTAENAGQGSVEGGYEFSYTPESVFQDCVNNHQ